MFNIFYQSLLHPLPEGSCHYWIDLCPSKLILKDLYVYLKTCI